MNTKFKSTYPLCGVFTTYQNTLLILVTVFSILLCIFPQLDIFSSHFVSMCFNFNSNTTVSQLTVQEKAISQPTVVTAHLQRTVAADKKTQNI